MWNYTYDAENRLIMVATDPFAVTAGFHNRTLELNTMMVAGGCKNDRSTRRLGRKLIAVTFTTGGIS